MMKLGAMEMIFTASYEGVGALQPGVDEKQPWKWTQLGVLW